MLPHGGSCAIQLGQADGAMGVLDVTRTPSAPIPASC